jgi:hypothetical protein
MKNLFKHQLFHKVMELEFELLKPGVVTEGDLFLDASRVNVSGITPNFKKNFAHPQAPLEARASLSRMPFIEPYLIYEVTQAGFKFRDRTGEFAGEHTFDRYFGGMVIPKDPDNNKIYVGHQFLAYLRQLKP